MLGSSAGIERATWRAWRTAAEDPAIDAAIRGVYADLAAETERRAPVCEQSGRCCRFDAYGHLLFVTGLEVAWFLRHAPEAARPRDTGTIALPQARPPGCVYQVDGRCTAHATRPLGCRVYFCQPGTEAWQQDVYERLLDDLRRLHREHGLPYRYVEWREALAAGAAALGVSLPAGVEAAGAALPGGG